MTRARPFVLVLAWRCWRAARPRCATPRSRAGRRANPGRRRARSPPARALAGRADSARARWTPEQRRFSTRCARGDPARRRSAGATGSSRTASPSCCRGAISRASRTLPGVRHVSAPTTVPRCSTGPDAATIGARGAPGAEPRERRRGDQDRDHRRRRRPDASVLRSGRVHDAAGFPKGQTGTRRRR